MFGIFLNLVSSGAFDMVARACFGFDAEGRSKCLLALLLLTSASKRTIEILFLNQIMRHCFCYTFRRILMCMISLSADVH